MREKEAVLSEIQRVEDNASYFLEWSAQDDVREFLAKKEEEDNMKIVRAINLVGRKSNATNQETAKLR